MTDTSTGEYLFRVFWLDYFHQPVWPIHAVLVSAMVLVTLRGRLRSTADTSWLWPGGAATSAADTGCRASVLSAALLQNGQGVDLSPADAGDLYEREVSTTHDHLGRIANLFLLSGVVGTLIGLFGATRRIADGSDLATMLSTAFSAFSMTAVAVALSALALVVQAVIARSDSRNVQAFVAHWARVYRRAPADADRPAADMDLSGVRSQLERSAGALESLRTNIENMQTGYVEAFQQLQSEIERPIARAVVAFDRLDEKVTEIENATTERLEQITSRFDDIRSDFSGVGEIVATCRRLGETMEVTSRAVADLPQSAATTHARYLEDVDQMRKRFEETLSTTLNAVATLEVRMGGLSGSLDRVVDRYLEKLESATAQHLERLTSRLGDVEQWAPQVHAALEQMRPDAERATASLGVLREQSSGALEQLRDRLGEIVEHSGRLAGMLQETTQYRGQRWRVAFALGGAATLAMAGYVAWRLVIVRLLLPTSL